MNAQKLITAAAFATIALGATTAALAQEATPEPLPVVTSSVTRADVQAQLAQARADGSIRFARADYVQPFRSVLSREAVKAETLAAIRSGEAAAINAEVYTFAPALAVWVARSAR